ncbi:MAG: HPF/RaiA family ribosome-associated protein [Verrucomicrobiae bacterium]|nr:HPF/RaiA family ribosome-associated protein [Verrucomicrobiae bacterium]MDW8309037.1 HPF/RaiA family ribosome-associated protein [Verrucomicrobiales bacterium]
MGKTATTDTTMRLNVQHINVRSLDTLDSWVEQQVLALGQCRQIDEANVRLECRFESSPPFAVRIDLVTPGPDLFAESRDYTLPAAFSKAMTQLREQIAHRASRRVRRLKSNLTARRGR